MALPAVLTEVLAALLPLAKGHASQLTPRELHRAHCEAGQASTVAALTACPGDLWCMWPTTYEHVLARARGVVGEGGAGGRAALELLGTLGGLGRYAPCFEERLAALRMFERVAAVTRSADLDMTVAHEVPRLEQLASRTANLLVFWPLPALQLEILGAAGADPVGLAR